MMIRRVLHSWQSWLCTVAEQIKNNIAVVIAIRWLMDITGLLGFDRVLLKQLRRQNNQPFYRRVFSKNSCFRFPSANTDSTRAAESAHA
jgi:hypothetical protein